MNKLLEFIFSIIIILVIVSVIVLGVFGLISSIKKINANYFPKDYLFVYNQRAKIVQINQDSGLSNDKFKTPMLCNLVLFNIVDTKQYFLINSCEYNYKINLDYKWVLTHDVGDLVYFDYLKKDRLFVIK
jgi:hypothetical protein